jgi:diguanylate cyclase (GGDEF)-like protein
MISFNRAIRAVGQTEDRLRAWYQGFSSVITTLEAAAVELAGGEQSPLSDDFEKARTGLTANAEPGQIAQSGSCVQTAVSSLVRGLVDARITRDKEFKKIIWITAEAGAAMVRSGTSHAEEIRGFASQIEATSCLESVVEIRCQMSKRLEELNQVARRIEEDSERNAASLSREIQRVQDRLKTAETLAETDSLTKLGNRRLLERKIAAAVESQTQLCVVVLDLDGFKGVNDRFGHQVGDRLLQGVANSLANSVRETDIVGRWGGDEFVILFHSIGLAEAEKRVSQIQKAAFGEFIVGEQGKEVRLTVSACIGLAERRVDETGDELFDRADRNLYELKRALREPRSSRKTFDTAPVLALNSR